MDIAGKWHHPEEQKLPDQHRLSVKGTKSPSYATDMETAVPRVDFNLPAPCSETSDLLQGGEFTLLFLAAVPVLRLFILPVALPESEICWVSDTMASGPNTFFQGRRGKSCIYWMVKKEKLSIGVPRQFPWLEAKVSFYLN